jgi:hypothetical protein
MAAAQAKAMIRRASFVLACLGLVPVVPAVAADGRVHTQTPASPSGHTSEVTQAPARPLPKGASTGAPAPASVQRRRDGTVATPAGSALPAPRAPALGLCDGS